MKAYQPGAESAATAQPVVGGMSLLEQRFNLMNPYGVELAKLKQKMEELLQDSTAPDQQKVAMHV